MKKFSEINEGKESKRSIRRTNAGNIQGYVGGKHYRHIGDAYYQPHEDFAEKWIKGEVHVDASAP